MDTGKLYGLIFGCPFGDCADDCPFNQIRKLPPNERIDYIEKLSPSERTRLVELHNNRFAIRENENRKNSLKKP